MADSDRQRNDYRVKSLSEVNASLEEHGDEHSHIDMVMLKKLPWNDHPAFMTDPTIEGYRDYKFGARAGPETDGWNCMHEMAHAVQFRANNFRSRVKNGSFVFKKPGAFWSMGHYCYEPTSTRGTMRELETFAIQFKMIEFVLGKQDVREYVKHITRLISWLPDHYNLYKSTLINGNERKTSMLNISQKHLMEFYDKWSFEMIAEEMNRWLDKTQKHIAIKK